MSLAPAVTVVLPCFNEASGVADNLRRLLATLDRQGVACEVLVVDDGSRDATAAIAEGVASAEPRIRVLRHEKNRGKGAALSTGCAAARGEVVVLLDADLQIPPEDVLPLLVRMREAGADIGVGSKYHPESDLVWPWRRRVLSRLYHFVTALLFRLPLRDTQTGLKALGRRAATELVPRLSSRRFAWDLELLFLAHETGHLAVAAPVHVAPSSRASRVTLRAALVAGLDTVRIFLRHRALGAYGLRRPDRRLRTRVIVNGDDLGMSRSVNEGLVRGLEGGGLTSTTVLVGAGEARAGLDLLRRRAPGAAVGLHLDLVGEAGLGGFVLSRTFRKDSLQEVTDATRDQLRALSSLGVSPTHVDAHRHAWLSPRLRAAVARATASAGLPAVRSLKPLGPLFASGPVEGAKRLILLSASLLAAGIPQQHGLRVPDGHVDAQEAARWVARGAIPRYARGRLVEVICHPAVGPSDLPPTEERTLDRPAETRAVLEPPLARGLERLGAELISYRDLA